MVSVLASSGEDRGFEPRSCQTKDYTIGICCFSARHSRRVSDMGIILTSGADPETLLTGVLSYGAIFSIIDGTNCSPKAVLASRSVNLVFTP